MSFQAYLDNITAKTGKSPQDFRRAASKADLLAPGVAQQFWGVRYGKLRDPFGVNWSLSSKS